MTPPPLSPPTHPTPLFTSHIICLLQKYIRNTLFILYISYLQPLTSLCPLSFLLVTYLSRDVSITVLKTAVATTIGDSTAQTWLSVTGSTTIDVYKNTISLITPVHAVQVGPQIVRFSLDMNTGKVILVFSKDMNLVPGANGGKFDPSKIGFFSLVTGRYYYLAGLTSNGVNTTLTNHTLVSPVSKVPDYAN